MEDEIKIVNCGCGGEAKVVFLFGNTDMCLIECDECGICTSSYNTEAEAITAWNKAMGAKDINVPNKTVKFKQDGEFLRCGKCNRIVDSGYKYCPECGYKLEFE